MATGDDELTGRPMSGNTEAIETLTDEELAGELTIASLYPGAPT